MSIYKLIYFNFLGRAELSRYILAYCGINYEDVRVPLEEWSTMKPSTPFGVLPVLELEDKRQLSGGLNIARYLGEKHGLAAPADDVDPSFTNGKLFAIIDRVQDAFTAFAAPLMEKDEDKKVKMRKETVDDKLSFFLSKFESSISDTGPFVLGEKVSYPDFYLQIFCEQITNFYPEIDLGKYPRLSQLNQSIIAIPAIADWLKRRPKCNYSYYF